MRPFLLLALTLATSPAAAAVPSGCQEDYVTCKEDCSIEFGGSNRTVSQLTRCIGQCQQTQDTCARKHSSLKRPAGVTNERAREGGRDDPYAEVSEEPARGGTAAPAAKPAPAVTRQGVYRASEPEPAPAPKPAAAPAPEPEEDEGLVPMDDVPAPVAKPAAKAAQKPAAKEEPAKPAPVAAASEDEKDPLFDEEPPPPPPEKKPAPVAAPSRPQSPPEPKKKDISEWDPNGD